MHVQGSREWHMERLGHVTASRFHDVLTNPQSKERRRLGLLSATAEGYLEQLLAEHLTGEPTEEIKAKPLAWGKTWEPVARIAYSRTTSEPVEEVGFYKHPTEPLIGASADSFVGTDGVTEIKCPLTGRAHLSVLRSKEVPKEHNEQIQGILWVTDRKWCDFVSYHDRFPPPLRLKVIRVHRDRFWQEMLTNHVIHFRNTLVTELQKLLAMWDTQ